MPFNSFQFFVFFPVVGLLYYLTPAKYRWVELLAVSYFFYLFTGFRFVAFLLCTTATAYLGGIGMGETDKGLALLLAPENGLSKEQKKEARAQSKQKKKQIAAVVLCVNFGILAVLKYLNFFDGTVDALLRLFHAPGSLPILRLVLPLGISFYTFQAMGYVIDVYRGKYPPEKNPAKFALFLAFFPQILEGPIGRYGDLAPQLYAPHELDYDGAKYALQLMLWGYFKKVVIADRAAILVNMVYKDYHAYSGLQIAFVSIVYAVQIYADFSGCVDIATGAAQFFGIRLAQNFDRPYFSKTVSEFWRRWHMTLGSWFRDYLFYPVSLSKAGGKLGKFCRKHFGVSFGKNAPAVLGLSVVWITTGLWHGADWHYVLYGVYYGVLIIAALLCRPLIQKLTELLHIRTEGFGFKLFRTLRTFVLVCFGFILFRADNMGQASGMIKSIFTLYRPAVSATFFTGDFSKFDLVVLALSTGVLFTVSLLQRKGHLREALAKKPVLLRWSVYCTALLSLIFFGVLAVNDPTQFIYFQF